MTQPRTLFDKIWHSHLVHEQDDGTCLLYIDRHLAHEITSAQAFEGLRENGRGVRRPDLTLTVADHNVPTSPGRGMKVDDEEAQIQIDLLRSNAEQFGIEFFDMNDIRQGIVHIIGPEQGLTLPGSTIVCGDSHTATHGAFGALAFGIGTSEVEHVLATQTLIQRPLKNMRIAVDGALPLGVTAKDLILAIIGKIGTAGGTGHVIEYAGPAIRNLSMEGRMTVCNMTIEAGARAGLVGPDDTTFDYLKGRPKAPKGAQWEAALAYWKTLPSDQGARYETEVSLDASEIPPIVTWGTSPQEISPITGNVPTLDQAANDAERNAWDPHVRLYGPRGRRADDRSGGRLCLHRLLHQRPDRGHARGRGGREGPPGGRGRARPGRAGLRPGQGTGRTGRAGPHPVRSRLRMARARLLDVPGDECGQGADGRALRLDLEPQFRGPAGPRRTHPSGEPGDGGGGGGQRPSRRRAGALGRLRGE